MRKLAVAGVLLASCTLAAAQEPSGREDAPHPGGNWLTSLWPWGSRPEPKKAEEKDDAPSPAEIAAAKRRREDALFKRRSEVIIKLEEIAHRTGDDALLRKCDALAEQANELYLQHTGGPVEVPTSAARPLPRGTPAATGIVHDVDGSKGEKR